MNWERKIIESLHDNVAKTESGGNIALDPDYAINLLTVTGAGAPTLADGEVIDQLCIVYCVANASNNNADITPANLRTYAKVRLANKGDYVVFRWEGVEWYVLKTGRSAAAMTS